MKKAYLTPEQKDIINIARYMQSMFSSMTELLSNIDPTKIKHFIEIVQRGKIGKRPATEAEKENAWAELGDITKSFSSMRVNCAKEQKKK
ncbi:MAG: hypothetical protein FWC61_03890 [Proteobacteria bacterium]|nr:hypothetical protein [Pseudomonadota bacterium]